MKNNIKLAALGLLLITIFFVDNKVVSAADSKSFSISPPNFEITANPGDVTKNTLKITNLSEKTTLYKVESLNFEAYGIEGQVTLTEETSSYSIKDWIQYESGQFVIEPNDFYLLNFTINVPENAEPGSHFGAAVISSGGTLDQGQSGASVVQEIGALILIRVPGDINEDGKIISFTTANQTYTEPKIKFDSIVENTGSIHYKLSPQVAITDIFGNPVTVLTLEPRNILPGSQRLFSQEFDFDKFGFFNAKFNATVGSTNKVISSDVSFFSLYLSRSLPIVLILLSIVVLYLIFRKRINKAIKILVKG